MIRFHFNPTAQSWQPAQFMPTHYKAAFDMNNAEELPTDAMFKRFIHNVLTNPKGDLNKKNPTRDYYYQLCFL